MESLKNETVGLRIYYRYLMFLNINFSSYNEIMKTRARAQKFKLKKIIQLWF